MTIQEEIKHRIQKYKDSLEKTPQKKELIQNEIDFLNKIRVLTEPQTQTLNEIRDILLDLQEISNVIPDFYETKHKIESQFPDFDCEFFSLHVKNLSIHDIFVNLIELNKNCSKNIEYWQEKQNQTIVKKYEKEREILGMLTIQINTLSHFVMYENFKTSNDLNTSIKLCEMLVGPVEVTNKDRHEVYNQLIEHSKIVFTTETLFKSFCNIFWTNARPKNQDELIEILTNEYDIIQKLDPIHKKLRLEKFNEKLKKLGYEMTF